MPWRNEWWTRARAARNGVRFVLQPLGQNEFVRAQKFTKVISRFISTLAVSLSFLGTQFGYPAIIDARIQLMRTCKCTTNYGHIMDNSHTTKPTTEMHSIGIIRIAPHQGEQVVLIHGRYSNKPNPYRKTRPPPPPPIPEHILTSTFVGRGLLGNIHAKTCVAICSLDH